MNNLEAQIDDDFDDEFGGDERKGDEDDGEYLESGSGRNEKQKSKRMKEEEEVR